LSIGISISRPFFFSFSRLKIYRRVEEDATGKVRDGGNEEISILGIDWQ
jgi:hypothetical protein